MESVVQWNDEKKSSRRITPTAPRVLPPSQTPPSASSADWRRLRRVVGRYGGGGVESGKAEEEEKAVAVAVAVGIGKVAAAAMGHHLMLISPSLSPTEVWRRQPHLATLAQTTS